MIDEPLGIYIHKLRHERGLSQLELAQQADISQTYISQIERDVNDGRFPSINVLVNIASALEVHPQELLRRSRRINYVLLQRTVNKYPQCYKILNKMEQDDISILQYNKILEILGDEYQ